jgi:pimeloyl-ACP methyl ester carboxylesterase
MPTAIVNGLKIAYELHGEGEPVVLTPGGRFSMDTAGVRELAMVLARGGKKVLIWDRPNCGASAICLEGESEFNVHADALAGLIKVLKLGKVNVIGGSHGSRCSLTTAIRHPEVINRLAVWWVSGGYFHYTAIANYYYGNNWLTAKRYGMEAVTKLPMWQETLDKNPENRKALLTMNRDKFTAAMEAWGPTIAPYPDSPVLGLPGTELAKIKVPTLIFRGSPTDFFHHASLTEQLHELIPGSRLVESPWGIEEWNERSDAQAKTGVNNLFASWPKLAPQLLDFLAT